MEVYTFSTGGCIDGFYLDSLSLTKDGVKDLITKYLYLDSAQNIKSFNFTDDEEIIVTIWDNDLNSSFKKEFDLITFTVS